MTVQPLPVASFGDLLKHLRRRAGLTQAELAVVVGFSLSQISLLEKNKRLPDLRLIAERFAPALALGDEPQLLFRLLELAAAARGESLPKEISLTHTVAVSAVTTTVGEEVEHFYLPALPVRVIGRESDIDQAGKRLMQAPGRLLTLTGAPGVGKTTLAIAIAGQLHPLFADGVCFVPLATLTTAELLPQTLATALGLPDSAPHQLKQRLVNFLRRRSFLLVLDNFEQLLPETHADNAEAVRLVADLLGQAPGLRILVTSRSPLKLRSEQRQPVEPITVAHGALLFIERAQAVMPDFSPNVEERLTIAAICRQIDSLPLAIELVAARIDLMNVGRMLAALQTQRLDLLDGDLQDLPPRHRTLRRAIAHSYHLLDERDQGNFRRLAVFAGGFGPVAAGQIGSDEAGVQRLVRRSLVRSERFSDGSQRFSLLETLRDFAAEELAQTAEAPVARLAHARYFASLAQEIFVGLRGEEQLAWAARAQRDHDNFRAALRYAIDQDNGDLAVELAGGLWWFWYRQGFLSEGRRWLAAAFACSAGTDPVCQADPVQYRRRRAMAGNGGGSMATEQGDFATAWVYHRQALALFREIDDQAGVAIVLHNMGLTARCQGDFPTALRLLAESLAIERAQDPTGTPDVLGYANVGITAFEMGDTALGRQWLDQAHALAKNEGDEWTQAFIANALAEVHRVEGMPETARALASTSLALFQKLGDTHYEPEPRLALGHLALERGDLLEAQRQCDAVLAAYQTTQDTHGLALALQLQAWIRLAGGQPGAREEAQALVTQSVALRASFNRALSPLEIAQQEKLQQALDGAGRAQ